MRPITASEAERVPTVQKARELLGGDAPVFVVQLGEPDGLYVFTDRDNAERFAEAAGRTVPHGLSVSEEPLMDRCTDELIDAVS